MTKQILIILLIIVIITIILAGCKSMNNNKQVSEDTVYKKISAEEAKKIIDSEDVVVLDVRTQEEYSSGHIKNSVLLPVSEISNRAEEVLTDKDEKILIYCRSGNRSKTAAMELIDMGYTNVYDFGGIQSWPYEIEY